MRKPLPPRAVLSRDGRFALVEYDYEFSLLDVGKGVRQPLTFPHEVTRRAFSPQGGYFAVAGYDRLSLFETRPTPRMVKTIKIPGELSGLAVGEQGMVAGIARLDATHSSLCIWQAATLKPLLGEAGEDFGNISPAGLELDETHGRLIFWGLEGPEASSGYGEFYARLVAFDEDGVEVLWAAEDSPVILPEGFLLPVAASHLGIYDNERLVIVDPARPELPLKDFSFGGLEKVVVSLDGNYLACLSGKADSEEAGSRLRIFDLSDGKELNRTDLSSTGAFVGLAVNNSGKVVITGGHKPATLSIFQPDQNQSPRQLQL